MKIASVKLMMVLGLAIGCAACDVNPPLDRVVSIAGFNLDHAKLVGKEYRESRLGSEGQRILVYQLNGDMRKKVESCAIDGYSKKAANDILKNYPQILPYIDPSQPLCLRHGGYEQSGIAVLQGRKLIVLMII